MEMVPVGFSASGSQRVAKEPSSRIRSNPPLTTMFDWLITPPSGSGEASGKGKLASGKSSIGGRSPSRAPGQRPSASHATRPATSSNPRRNIPRAYRVRRRRICGTDTGVLPRRPVEPGAQEGGRRLAARRVVAVTTSSLAPPVPHQEPVELALPVPRRDQGGEAAVLLLEVDRTGGAVVPRVRRGAVAARIADLGEPQGHPGGAREAEQPVAVAPPAPVELRLIRLPAAGQREIGRHAEAIEPRGEAHVLEVVPVGAVDELAG